MYMCAFVRESASAMRVLGIKFRSLGLASGVVSLAHCIFYIFSQLPCICISLITEREK